MLQNHRNLWSHENSLLSDLDWSMMNMSLRANLKSIHWAVWSEPSIHWNLGRDPQQTKTEFQWNQYVHHTVRCGGHIDQSNMGNTIRSSQTYLIRKFISIIEQHKYTHLVCWDLDDVFSWTFWRATGPCCTILSLLSFGTKECRIQISRSQLRL
jgi:hypothetical protein